jgi:hypothetical protein
MSRNVPQTKQVQEREAKKAANISKRNSRCDMLLHRWIILDIALLPMLSLFHCALVILVIAWSKPRRRNREHINKCTCCQVVGDGGDGGRGQVVMATKELRRVKTLNVSSHVKTMETNFVFTNTR